MASRGLSRALLGPLRTLLTAALSLSLALSAPTPAQAAAPPQLGAAWATEVSAASATFRGEVNPEEAGTAYRFEYETEAAYQQNLAASKPPFEGAAQAPVTSSCPGTLERGCAGQGSAFVTVSQHVSALRSSTTYRYRLTASSPEGSEALETNPAGAPLRFATQEPGASFSLPDSRAWELVSPPDKNGGAIAAAESLDGGGVIGAAAGGGSITYSSAASFGGYEALGAPPASQYVSTRNGASGWATRNVTPPTLSGAYGAEPDGVPYQLFSADLARGLMLNGLHCRGEGTGCPVDAPVLEGSGAPAGFQDYYLRTNATGSFAALLTETNKGPLSLSAEQFNLALAGASPDLSHVVLSTCAKLTSNATEVAGSEGCALAEPNLYEWSGGGLSLVNLLPGETHGTPGARLAAQGARAVSEDGSRVYFTDEGNLYLREGQTTKLLLETSGGGAEFQAATPSGEVAFFTRAEHLYRYDAAAETATDLTPAGGVEGVLGISANGQTAYYLSNGGSLLPPVSPGIFRWHEGTKAQVAFGPGGEAAQPSDYPPTTGTARVSASGETLLFLSSEPLSGYDNHDATTGQPDSEVFLYEAGGGGTLRCLSCNPTGERPLGPTSIPGAYANGTQAGLAPGQILTDSYRPRALSANGRRAFFTSEDALAELDTNKAPDAYEWEAQGEGSCAEPGGCLSLLSSGQGAGGASFLDASASGADAYLLTSVSLTEPQNLPHVTITPQGDVDPGSADVYDARVGGGFAEPKTPIPCESDECAPLPTEPEDPTVGTLVPGPGNPPLRFPKLKRSCPKGKRLVKRHGHRRCVRKRRHHRRRHHRRRHHRKQKRGRRG